MPSTIITPAQGITNRSLLGVGHFYRVLFTPPQGIGEVAPPPPVANSWVDDLGNAFVDDIGNFMVFSP